MMHKFPQSADADLICASLNTSFDIWSGSRMGSPAAALFCATLFLMINIAKYGLML
jgi:hypothetical protein